MATASGLLKAQHTFVHGFVMMIVGDLTQEVAHVQPPGNVAPIAPIMAHMLGAEDFFVNVLVAGKPTILETGGWTAKAEMPAGRPMMTPEFATATFKIEGLKGYAQALFAEVEAYLGSASEADLEKLIDTPLGTKQPAAEFLSGLAISHVTAHAGEIAALKGVQGLKGLPF